MATNTLPSVEEDMQIDGNLHWDAAAEKPTDGEFFKACAPAPNSSPILHVHIFNPISPQ
jgi:hypothetical protein